MTLGDEGLSVEVVSLGLNAKAYSLILPEDLKDFGGIFLVL